MIGQVSTEKAIETITDQAKNWPVMVSVILVIMVGVLWFFYWWSEHKTKQLIAQMEKQHAETVEILKKELYESRQLLRETHQAILNMNA